MKVMVHCPACRHEFDAGAAIQQQVEQQAASQVAAREQELRVKEETLAHAKSELDAQVRRQLETERAKLRAQAQAAAREEVDAQLKARDAETAEIRDKLKAAQAQELQFLEQKRQFETQTAELKLTVQRQLEAERDGIRKSVLAQAAEQHRAASAGKDQELAALRATAEASKTREAELAVQTAALAKAKSDFAAEARQQLEAERAKLREQAQAAAREELDAQLKARDAETAEIRDKLKTAQARELDFLKQKQLLEEKTAEVELTIQRRIEEERQQIRQDATAKVQEQLTLTLRDKELLIERMKTEMDGLQRKLNQGSQQAQGEAQELVLEDQLRQAFPTDLFREVAKGVEGADVIQLVRDADGRDCGTILWESKRTKAWTDGWLAKLQSDRARELATIAALATQAMPKGITSIGQMEGVWICAFSHAVPMAMLLRQGMQEAAAARKSMEGQKDKMSLIYAYLTGNEFRSRATAVTDAWTKMLDSLNGERRAMEKIWRERERWMSSAMGGMQGIHRDLQTIAGANIQFLPATNDGLGELEALASGVPAPANLQPELAMDGAPPASAPLPPAFSPGAPAPDVPLQLTPAERGDYEVRFLAQLTELGGKAGNKSLREALAMNETDYEEIKTRLLAQNRIRAGHGRGGSVLLPSYTADEAG